MAQQYTVIEKGFHGRIRYPGETLTVTKAYKKCPSWLKPIEAAGSDETEEQLTPAQKAARTKAANKLAKEKAANAESGTPPNFTGEEPQGTVVETVAGPGTVTEAPGASSGDDAVETL